MVRYSLALLVGVAVAATAAFAVEPIGGGKFNVTAQVDLSKLNRENFASIVTPVAKQQTGHEIVFYDFADTLCEPLRGARSGPGFEPQPRFDDARHEQG